MPSSVSEGQVFRPSDDVVVRDMEGQLIIVPLVAGVGDLEAELFSLDKTGRAIWDRLDGQRSVAEVVKELQSEYDDPEGEMTGHVQGLLSELAKRGMVVEVAPGD
jgi:Coenzyme PQQ synthesis protein D (PqqD)